MVLSSEKLEKKLTDVCTYLQTSNVDDDDSQVRKAVKARAKHYLVYEGMLFRRTPAGLRYIPDVLTRTSILIGMHDEISHWDFRTTYKLIAERFLAGKDTT